MRHERFIQLASKCSSERLPIPCVSYVKFTNETDPRTFGYSDKKFSPLALVLLHHWFVEYKAANFEENARHYLKMLEVARVECPVIFDYTEGGEAANDLLRQNDNRAHHFERWSEAQRIMADIYENAQDVEYLFMICINPITLYADITSNTALYQSATIYENTAAAPESLKRIAAILKRRYEVLDAAMEDRPPDEEEEEEQENDDNEEPMILDDV